MMRSSRKPVKISRQISAAALGLISVVALLLSAGLIMYTSDLPNGGENISDPALPLVNPMNPYGIEVVPGQDPSLTEPAPEDSLASLTACILVVLAFVLVWFLVFRPEGTAAKSAIVISQDPII